MVVLIDNYDSFTYNLADYVNQLGIMCQIVKNDALDVADIAALEPRALMISPGPGDPDDAGVSLKAIEYFSGRLPILGVCLGHQAIGSFYGARIVKATQPMHGKIDTIYHDNQGMFGSLPNPLTVVRYHSLVVEPESVPHCLVVSAKSEDGSIMGLRHKTLPIEGIQFHPEAILTSQGMALLQRFFQHYLPVREPS